MNIYFTGLRASAVLLTLFALSAGRAAATEEWVILHNFGGEYVVQPESTLVETTPGIFVGSYISGLFQVTHSGAFSVLDSFLGTTYSGANSGALTPAEQRLLLRCPKYPEL